MKEVKGNKMTTYKTGHEDFIIDIVETTDIDGEQMYETWLYRENTGTKHFVIGEYKKYYPGMTVKQYARTQIDYIRTVNKKGMNYYDIYDEYIEIIEVETWKRIQAEKGLSVPC